MFCMSKMDTFTKLKYLGKFLEESEVILTSLSQTPKPQASSQVSPQG